jgi:hypothetical protein
MNKQIIIIGAAKDAYYVNNAKLTKELFSTGYNTRLFIKALAL